MLRFLLLGVTFCCSASALLLPSAMPRVASSAAVAVTTAAPSKALLLLAEDDGGIVAQLEAFQESHAFIIGILVAIATRVIINEARYRIEKPVMDELGNRAKESMIPDTDRIEPGAWAKLAACVALDLAGDASELLPVLGEFTDIAYAPVEAAVLQAFFKSPAIAAFGFAEEILPFTDIIPTFTLSWCLSTLWPTTPLAQKLLPAAAAKK